MSDDGDDFIKDFTKSMDKVGFKVLTGDEAKMFFELMNKRTEEIKNRRTPRYHYESKYQFPDDIDLGGTGDFDPEGFRNSTHLSISRGMEYMEIENLAEYEQLRYKHIGGITRDNSNMRRLKNHINKCVMKELGDNWGHSGASMSYVAAEVLKAKELGWDKYIEEIRNWKKKEEQKQYE